jgi:hypothetical protein
MDFTAYRPGVYTLHHTICGMVNHSCKFIDIVYFMKVVTQRRYMSSNLDKTRLWVVWLYSFIILSGYQEIVIHD